MPIGGSEKDIVNIQFDRTKGNIQWSPDEKYLYFTSQSNGGVTLNRVDIQTRKVESAQLILKQVLGVIPWQMIKSFS